MCPFRRQCTAARSAGDWWPQRATQYPCQIRRPATMRPGATRPAEPKVYRTAAPYLYLSCRCLAFAHWPPSVLPGSCSCLSLPSESLNEHPCDLVGMMGLAACYVQRREMTLARRGHRCLWSRCSGCRQSWTMAMCRASSIAQGERHPVPHSIATPYAAQVILLPN